MIDMKKSTLIRRAVSILIALAMSFACIPAFTGSLDVNAAAPYWKNYKVKSEAYTSNTITWKKLTKKQRKKISGIAVFQGTDRNDLKCIKRIRKTRTSYKTSNVKAGTKYCYQLKTYKIRKVKQKQYYNKKTKKWQTKKIKNARKRTVKVTRYKYANKSSVKWVTTKRKPTATGPTFPKPAKVTGFRAAVVTSFSTDITWNKLSGITGYQVYLDGSPKCSIGSGENVLRINRLTYDTAYQIKIRAYRIYNSSTVYGDFSAITIRTTKKGSPPRFYGERIYPTTLDYRNIPEDPGYVQIGDGTFVHRNINKRLLTITNAWMADNLPADATDAEKVNMALKCMNELIDTPQSTAIMGSNPSNYSCGIEASYFDTCCKSAGIISATRNCTFDECYGIPFIPTHFNNFVWVDGTGYIINANYGRGYGPVLALMDYDWNEWHAVPTNTKFNCRYY